MKTYLAGLLSGVAVALAVMTLAVTPPIPRLIAHDCYGAGGDLWAMDETDFPAGCGMIEANR